MKSQDYTAHTESSVTTDQKSLLKPSLCGSPMSLGDIHAGQAILRNSPLFPSSRQGVHTPLSSVSFSQRRAQGMNDEVLGTYACSKTHNHTVTKPPESKAAFHRQTKRASWNKQGQAEIDRKIEANPHTIPPPTETFI